MSYDKNQFLGWYLVAFVDILGQERLLQQMRGLPETTDEKQLLEFKALHKNTFRTIIEFRDHFIRFFDGLNKPHIDLGEFTQEQRKIFDQAKSNPLKSHMFSDFVVLFLSLRDDYNKVPMKGVSAVLGSIASTFLIMLAKGHTIRGGVDIGIGIELSDNDIYGSALSRAYKIESKIAKYPRIVIGDELKNYIQWQKNKSDDDIFAIINKRMAELTESLTDIDNDGFPFLHYLGEGFKQYIAKNNSYIAVERAYDFVVKESSKYQDLNDSKLASRYELLRNYFENNIFLWREQ